jgi:hypothetical protein
MEYYYVYFDFGFPHPLLATGGGSLRLAAASKEHAECLACELLRGAFISVKSVKLAYD